MTTLTTETGRIVDRWVVRATFNVGSPPVGAAVSGTESEAREPVTLQPLNALLVETEWLVYVATLILADRRYPLRQTSPETNLRIHLRRLRRSEPTVLRLRFESPLIVELLSIPSVAALTWWAIRHPQEIGRFVPDLVHGWREGWSDARKARADRALRTVDLTERAPDAKRTDAAVAAAETLTAASIEVGRGLVDYEVLSNEFQPGDDLHQLLNTVESNPPQDTDG